METIVSNGVEVSVETFFQPEYSSPLEREFMFAYRITIRNCTGKPVQLLSRRWDITDSGNIPRVVEGEGVIGLQPRFGCNEEYQYVSGCNLKSEIGRMMGIYYFKDLYSGEIFEVDTPIMNFIVPYKLN